MSNHFSAANLKHLGVPVTGVRYLGTIHDFVMRYALRQTDAAQAAITQAIATLQAALGN
jgi:acetyl esterase